MKLIAFALAFIVTLSAAAQTTTTPPPTPAPTATPGHGYNIGVRKEHQRDRIEQGVDSGQLTRGEQRRLNTQERGINREERGMRAQDNGHLTKQDRMLIHKQQNQESRRIYRDKHNAKVGKPR